MAETFTFRNEVLNKCNGDESCYELFMSSFDALPIAADVNSDYLCMHGGISPELNDVKDIDKIDRFLEPPLQGFLCDILWSDPSKDNEHKNVKFARNTPRECSYIFGLDPVKKVLKNNNYLSMIRGHQV